MPDNVIRFRPRPARFYQCLFCGSQSVPSLLDGEPCLACGEQQWEPFRTGWDESD